MLPPVNNQNIKRLLIDHLSQFVLERRLNALKFALENRTRYLTVVLEDIFQSQNASAVLRTCECFGIQNVHIIENHNKFNINPKVVLGSTKWLTINRYKAPEFSTLEVINSLKREGYRVVATSPHANDTALSQFDLGKGKAAFVFGTELTGLSQTVMENADEFVYIPMVGLTESLNISVSAAVCMHYLINKLRLGNLDYSLTEPEKDELMYQWLKLSVKSANALEKRFMKTLNAKYESKK